MCLHFFKTESDDNVRTWTVKRVCAILHDALKLIDSSNESFEVTTLCKQNSSKF